MNKFSIPTYRSIQDYKDQQWPILIWIFEYLVTTSEAKLMIETFSEEGLYDQLAYHQKLLLSACDFNSSPLLNDYMSWRYRLAISRGIDPKYFIFENHLWIKAIQAYLFEGYSSEFNALYYEFIDSHQEFSTSTSLPPSALSENTLLKEELVQALIHTDENSAAHIFADHFYHFGAPTDFFDTVIKPTMIEIGRLWENNTISVATEHVATAMIERLWNRFSNHDTEDTFLNHRVAFVITPDAQLHKLGSKMVSSLLTQRGWKVANMGLHESFKELFEAIGEFRPDLIILSATMAIYIPLIQKFVLALRFDEPVYEGKIVVGGQAFYRTFPPILMENVDFQGESLKELDEYLSHF